MEGIREFLEYTTIHGLVFIPTTKRLVKVFWMFVVLIGFTVAAVLIQQSFATWARCPISTTIETRPISELDFPGVIICPPKKSFTSLYPDLVASRNIDFTQEKRKELSDFVPDAAYAILQTLAWTYHCPVDRRMSILDIRMSRPR